MNVEFKLKRIAENLWLNQNERDKLFEIYNNSYINTRDSIVDEVLEKSKIRSIEIRHDLRQRIRKS